MFCATQSRVKPSWWPATQLLLAFFDCVLTESPNCRAVHWKPDPVQPGPAPELPTQMQIPCVLTAREGQGAGMSIHGEVVQLQLALCIDSEPMKETSNIWDQRQHSQGLQGG